MQIKEIFSVILQYVTPFFTYFFLLFLNHFRAISSPGFLLTGGFRMFGTVKSFIKDESGATAIEYGLIAALVSVAAIAALTALGDSLETMFTNVSNALDSAQPSTP